MESTNRKRKLSKVTKSPAQEAKYISSKQEPRDIKWVSESSSGESDIYIQK